ncbi:MAG: Cys-tRNA(Pro) deacylase [Candidatus Sericytochromatia bacterium]|nr:Cys-tRNA(Pro) deacylase [Candidatus Sericytochromatia bacterium]
MSKTNAIRILESKKINYSTCTYQVNEDKLDAVTVAIEIGAEPESVFKTLVTRGDKTGINVFCIPANMELNLKKASIVSCNKSVEMIKVKEITDITGYIRGGCSPIGMKKEFPTYIDETSQLFEEIYISAGMRGMQIKIKPDDLTKLVKGSFVDLI